MKLEVLIGSWSRISRLNPNLVVYIRADENSRTKELAALIDGCQRNGITRYSLRTQPAGTPMSRLYKKCFIASGGLHLLLALILLACPAFLAPKPRQSDVQPITFVP